jgi:diacylglycerol kinase family enzyme
VDVADTERRGHAIELAASRGREYDAVVAFGGDGTVNEAANGLADGAPGPPTPLACLPGGQANIFVKMLGMPGDPLGACEHLVHAGSAWRPRAVDLGVVNGRCFTFASGLGLDATVTGAVDTKPHLKSRLGPWYYAWVMGTTLIRRYLVNPPRLAVRVGDAAATNGARALQGVTAVVQNGAAFTFFNDRPIAVADGGALDSGTLAGCVLRRFSPLDAPSLMYRAMSPRAPMSGHGQVDGFGDAAALTVTSTDGRPLPLQVDGDYIGDVLEANYSIRPGALSVLA